MPSAGELLVQGDQPSNSPQMARWRERVTAAFRQYDQIVEDYREVPAAAKQIKAHVARQRRRPECAVVLNEPEAKALWEVAQQHEADDHGCCAYWVYRQAARLVPAPSASRAAKRLAEMAQDPKLIAAAEECRELQKCHQIYSRAERLIPVEPDRAKELFAQVVQRAPKDSEVYRAAQSHLGQLPQ